MEMRRKSCCDPLVICVAVVTFVGALWVARAAKDFLIEAPKRRAKNAQTGPNVVIADESGTVKFNLPLNEDVNTELERIELPAPVRKPEEEEEIHEQEIDLVPIDAWPLSGSGCSATFGNGWSERKKLCGDPSLGGSAPAFLCKYNPTSKSMLCDARNIVVDSSKVKVSMGGEEIKDVLGRREDDEFCSYSTGAFALPDATTCQEDVLRKDTSFHLVAMVDSFTTGSGDCSNPVDKTALFVTRYEYANLYHTMTDWYNAYASVAAHGLVGQSGNIEVVFFDGHSWGKLDDAWGALFGSYSFVKHKETPVCYKRALFVPAGYMGGVSLNTITKSRLADSCTGQPEAREFARWFLARFGFEPRPKSGAAGGPTITLMLRKDYLAHPRIGNRGATRKIGNEQEVVSALEAVAPGAVVLAMNPAELTMREQVEIISKTDLLIGVHGAGMTYALLLPDGAHVIEMKPRSHRGEPHFKAMSNWAGLDYFAFTDNSGSDSALRVDVSKLASKAREMLATSTT